MITKFIIIGIGGFFGAITRYYLSGFVQNWFTNYQDTIFPVGTLAVNIIGCFLLGLFSGLLVERTSDPSYRFLINVGFLGALTTFSTFSLETWNLIEDKELLISFLNIFLSCTIGLLAVWLGKVFYRLIWG